MYALYRKEIMENDGTGSGECDEAIDLRMILDGEGSYNEKVESEKGEESEKGDDLVMQDSVGGVDMEGISKEAKSSEDDIEGAPSHEGCLGEQNVIGLPIDAVEASEEIGVSEMGREGELVEQDGWPSWLRSAVNMLHAGERGKAMESIVIKLIKIERCLGFKGEKTASTI